MTTPAINQKEYLKKYLRSDGDAKKKKKKAKVGSKNVKIIDDDIDLKNIRPMEDGEFDIFNTTEDAPQIVGIVDERGPVDFADKRRWKIIADDGEGNVAVSCSAPKSRDEPENISDNAAAKDSKKRSRPDKRSKENGNFGQSPSRRSKKSDDDLSPPRKADTKKKSKKRRKKSSSSDSTSSSSSSSSSDSSDSEDKPKRKTKSKKYSKTRRKRDTDEDSDLSPPRPRKQRDSDDLTPPRSRKAQNRSDSDLSPPRKSQKPSHNSRKSRNNDSDLSPPRSKRKGGGNSDSDLSPPRRPQREPRDRKERRNDDSDLSPPRKSRREDKKGSRRDRKSDSDVSPPRRSNKMPSKPSRPNRGSDSDLSPPRHRKSDARHRSDMQERKSDSYRRQREKSPRRKHSRWNDDEKRSPSPEIDRRMKKTLDGKTAGLQDAQALREETLSHKKREAELFNKMSEEVSGRGRTAVVRDRKTGKRRDLEAEAAEKREKEKRQAEIDEKYAKWGRGLKQVEDQNEKLKDDLYEMSKPLARYADDADLDARQRATEHAEDPMLAYIKDKQIKEGKREPDAPNYEGSFMPNRFGIKPGHRWDGVDRSNGYERRWFEARNAKVAVQEEAYKWSTSDM